VAERFFDDFANLCGGHFGARCVRDLSSRLLLRVPFGKVVMVCGGGTSKGPSSGSIDALVSG
jgi:hypothetical protein